MWLKNLTDNYDNSVLIVLCLTYFMQGFKVFLFLSVKDLFKLYMELEPNESQFYSSLISLPWSFKIFYGIISDNFPIKGSRRRVYVMLNGALQALSLFIMVVYSEQKPDPVFVTVMLLIGQLNSAFLDVVVDAMMVT